MDTVLAKIGDDGVLRFYLSGELMNIAVAYPEMVQDGELYVVEELSDNQSGLLVHLDRGNGECYTFGKALDQQGGSIE